MRTDHDEIVAFSRFAHCRYGITYADVGRHRNVGVRQCQGRVVYNLLGIPLTLFGPAFESYYQMGLDHVQRGDD